MRIGIDARLYRAERTGIGSYTAHLIQSFARLAAEDEFVLFTDAPVPLPGVNFRNSVIDVRKRILWTLCFLPFRLRSERVDLFHGPANFEIPPAAPCRLVSTVHDLIPLHFPELVSRKFALLFRALMGRTLKNSDKVITDSEFSRQDILSRYPVPPEKVVVTPLAPHPRFNNAGDPGADREICRKHGLERPYLLFVGVFEPRKNIPFLVEAFNIFRRDCGAGREFQLALAGGKGYRGEDIVRKVLRRGPEPSVRLLGYVPDDELPALYRQAELFVFPSRYEGFGLPPLEAMACGVPVITSNTTSLPEVVGDAGVMIDPYDTGELVASMKRLLSDESHCHRLRQAGLQRATHFTWEGAAKETLKVYQGINDLHQH